MVRSVKGVWMLWITKNIMDETWEGDKGKKLEVGGKRLEDGGRKTGDGEPYGGDQYSWEA